MQLLIQTDWCSAGKRLCDRFPCQLVHTYWEIQSTPFSFCCSVAYLSLAFTLLTQHAAACAACAILLGRGIKHSLLCRSAQPRQLPVWSCHHALSFAAYLLSGGRRFSVFGWLAGCWPAPENNSGLLSKTLTVLFIASKNWTTPCAPCPCN